MTSIYIPFLSVAMLVGASALCWTAKYPQWWKLYLSILIGSGGFALFILWFIKSLW
jgi:hypothetical protein